jgi:protein-disulfide isomerase
VTIIAFSDYECPFCKRAEQTVEEVVKAYGDKVRVVHRDFPLAFHANARPAAEAAHCANAQGKFWPYHSKLFTSADLSADKLKALATEVGLDRAKFDDCVAKHQFKAAVDQDVADGSDVGVTGTPAFFINGRLLSGAQPFEKFKEVIDEELAQTKGKAPS